MPALSPHPFDARRPAVVLLCVLALHIGIAWLLRTSGCAWGLLSLPFPAAAALRGACAQ